MRHLFEVIDKILKVTPGTEIFFKSELERIKEKVMIDLTKSNAFWWIETANTIVNNFPPVEHMKQWQKVVVDIWADKV